MKFESFANNHPYLTGIAIISVCSTVKYVAQKISTTVEAISYYKAYTEYTNRRIAEGEKACCIPAPKRISIVSKGCDDDKEEDSDGESE